MLLTLQESIPPSSSSTSLQGDPAHLQQQQQQPTAYSPRPRQRLKRHNAKRDSRRIPLRYQKDRRAKFKSTDDLLHRLYVCISGAADQLQSNYAGDFRDDSHFQQSNFRRGIDFFMTTFEVYCGQTTRRTRPICPQIFQALPTKQRTMQENHT